MKIFKIFQSMKFKRINNIFIYLIIDHVNLFKINWIILINLYIVDIIKSNLSIFDNDKIKIKIKIKI